MDWNPRLLKDVEKELAGEGKVFVVNRAQPQSTESIVDEILSGSFGRIGVVGGDGTLNRVMNALARKNALGRYELGLLPFGTCNDFAKTIRLKAGELKTAFKRLREGALKEARVARVNGHCFINNAGFGRHNPVPGDRKPIRDILQLSPTPVRLEGGDVSLEGAFLMMLCANGPYFSGGLHFSNDSSPWDDRLEFFFVTAIPRWRLLWKLFLGKHGHEMEGAPDVIRLDACTLKLVSDEPLWIMADGEVVPELSGVKEALFEIAGSVKFRTGFKS